MQCQGTTRSGQRCRNRSLDGELFCDVHMRVNRVRNLTLLIPGLSLLLALYFLIFSLFLDATVYNLFQIPYFKLIGIEDAFLGLIQLAVLVLVGCLGLWLLYTGVLALIFAVLLTIHMIREVRDQPVSLGRKILNVLIGLTVLLVNMVFRLLLIVPFSGHARNGQVSVSQKRFSRAFFKLHNADGTLRAGRPFLAAKSIFERYLFFKEVGNHKVFSFTLILVGLSLVIGFHTWVAAKAVLACSSEPFSSQQQATTNTGYITLSSACNPSGELSVAARFLFPTHKTLLPDNSSATPLLHIGATSRYELFYDPQSAHPQLIPKSLFGTQKETTPTVLLNLSPVVEELQKFYNKLNHQINLLMLTVKDQEKTLLTVNHRLSEMEEKLHQYDTVGIPQQQGPAAPFCSQSSRTLSIAFESGSARVTKARDLKRLKSLAKRYQDKPGTRFQIEGIADLSGSAALNNKLSFQRAQKVSRILSEQGISPARLYLSGKGSRPPLTDRPSRRVDIKVCS